MFVYSILQFSGKRVTISSTDESKLFKCIKSLYLGRERIKAKISISSLLNPFNDFLPPFYCPQFPVVSSVDNLEQDLLRHMDCITLLLKVLCGA